MKLQDLKEVLEAKYKSHKADIKAEIEDIEIPDIKIVNFLSTLPEKLEDGLDGSIALGKYKVEIKITKPVAKKATKTRTAKVKEVKE